MTNLFFTSERFVKGDEEHIVEAFYSFLGRAEEAE
jgi:hypothetical protein